MLHKTIKSIGAEVISFQLFTIINKILAHKKTRAHKEHGFNKVGSDLLSHFYAVPSALAGLTSLFGMGRGGAPPL